MWGIVVNFYERVGGISAVALLFPLLIFVPLELACVERRVAVSAGIAAFVLRQRKHKRAAFCELQDACGGFPVFLHATRSFWYILRGKDTCSPEKGKGKNKVFLAAAIFKKGVFYWGSSLNKPRVILFGHSELSCSKALSRWSPDGLSPVSSQPYETRKLPSYKVTYRQE